MSSLFLQARKLIDPLRPRSKNTAAETTLDRLVLADAATDPGLSALDAGSAFMLRLGRALLSFGLPAQRLEDALTRVAGSLGLTIDCFSTPTALMATVSDGEQHRTRVVRLEPGDNDLERLSALHALVGRVERKELSPADASRRIDAIVARRSRYGEPTIVLAGGLASSASAVLLGGSATDLVPALSLGTLVALLQRLARRIPMLQRLVPTLAAFMSTLLARLIGLAGVEVHEPVLVLAAVIALLPGFTLTVSALELATANLVSGTSRLVGGISTLVLLGLGVALGHRAGALFPSLPEVPAAPPNPEWLLLTAHGVAAVAFMILLKAAPRDMPAILLGAAVSVAGARLGRAWLGPELGAFLGALLIGIASHVHARTKDRPTLLLLTPGILMLVPGSVGFLSISSMLAADTVTALETAFRAVLIAASLAAGVLVATVAVPPRRAL